jgi:hypothetical protein
MPFSSSTQAAANKVIDRYAPVAFVLPEQERDLYFLFGGEVRGHSAKIGPANRGRECRITVSADLSLQVSLTVGSPIGGFLAGVGGHAIKPLVAR